MVTDRTVYQNKIIDRYYENRDDIMLQKLSELVTELYLSEGKKRLSLWKRVKLALMNLNVSSQQIAFLIESDNPAFLAKFVQNELEK
ncbi:MAG: hypothetical protein Q4C95_00125 [Planctomycetia bacterium]|nr:hypothetical protein [Planctomycetia bacterium]